MNFARSYIPEKAYMPILYLVIVILSIVLTFSVGEIVQKVILPTTLSKDVQLGGLSLGGLTPAEAHKRLQLLLKAAETKPTRLVIGEKEWTLTEQDLHLTYDLEATYQSLLYHSNRSQGIRKIWDELMGQQVESVVEIKYSWDQKAAVSLLEKIKREVDQPSANARVEIQGDQVHFTPHQVGKTVLIEESLKQIDNSFATFQAERTVPITVKEEQPSIVSDQLQPIDTLLGEATTVLPNDFETVRKNVMKLVNKLNGMIIQPEEEFSFVHKAGPFTGNQEYLTQTDTHPLNEQGGVQFGIGQTASTLYWAALRSNLQVNERHPHLHPQAYISPGLDAAVWDEKLDLRLQNSFKQPVYVDARVNGNMLSIRFYGNHEDKKQQQIVVTTPEKFQPKTVYMIDGNLQTGESREGQAGEEGVLVEVYRADLVPQAPANQQNLLGKKENKIFLSKDYYRPTSRVVYIGPPPQLIQSGNSGANIFGNDQANSGNSSGDTGSKDNQGGSGFADDPNMAPSNSSAPPDIPSEQSTPNHSGAPADIPVLQP
ncbi:VanW family protein [Brevibacillus ginsengisoli]|uniref:VanW family protein n=1 Tax=Brevibacillus ginsengisoli TaxID=363854 RepID=UPI003CEC75DF